MKEKSSVEVRLDKWLWAARFYKTRAMAREMIEGGKVHYNGALYEETAESVEKREKMAQARKLNALTMPHPDRRPDKKERRDLLRFKHGDSE